MGVLDVVGVPVQARAAGHISGPALGVLAACGQRRAPTPMPCSVLSEPTVEFDGTMMAITAREEQIRTMLDALYIRLAEVTGREVDESAATPGRTASSPPLRRSGTASSPGRSNATGLPQGRSRAPAGPGSLPPACSPGAATPGPGAPPPGLSHASRTADRPVPPARAPSRPPSGG